MAKGKSETFAATSIVDNMIKKTMGDSNPDRFITLGEFQNIIEVINRHSQSINQQDVLNGLLQQQIAGVDIACGLILETVPLTIDASEEGKLQVTRWTQQDLKAFKKEHQRRVNEFHERLQKDIVKRQKLEAENKPKVTLA